MASNLPYEAPELKRWGSLSGLTQGQGMSSSQDDFVSTHPTQGDFTGSNDNEVMKS